MGYARRKRFANLNPEALNTNIEQEFQALETYLNSGSTTSIVLQDGENQDDPLDQWQLNIVNGELHIDFYDDSADTTITRMVFIDGGGINLRDASGNIVFRWNQTAGEVQSDNGNGTLKRVGSGRLIAFGQAGSNTEITNISSTMQKLSATEQTVACEYAGQEVIVEVTCFITWKNMAVGGTYIINSGIGSSNYGANVGLSYRPANTSSTSPGVSGSTGSTAPSVSGTSASGEPGSDVDVIGVTAEADGHSHGSGTLAALNEEMGHTHGAGSYAAASHSHTAGTLAADGHTHAAVPTRIELSAAAIATATANGSGNVLVSIYAQGDDTADVDGWWLTYKVYEAL